MSSFRLEVDDQVAVVTFDLADRSVNVIHERFFDEVAPIIEQVERDDEIRAAVIVSGKRDGFVAGADLDLVRSFASQDEASSFIRRGHELLNRVADSPKPWIAAIHGAAMGGGLELALACHGRVATDDPVTVLALPEVMVGLLPAGGGTQRLPQLVGLPQALTMMLTGSRIRARRALEIGLVDRLSSQEDLLRTVREIALGELTRNVPLSRSATLFPIIRGFILESARRRMLRKTRGRYPAPVAILEAVEAGLFRGFEDGLATEAAAFGRLAMSRESKNLMWLFHAAGELKKRPAPAARSIHRVGVVGAGLMGQGIAAVSLPVAEVVLTDVSNEALDRAERRIASGIEKRRHSGALTDDDAGEQRRHLRTTRSVDDLSDCDLVIEAVFEDLELKRRVFQDLRAPGSILASNTSALPIARIFDSIPDADRAVGMHYFSPVPKMPLLEIVRSNVSSDAAIDTAVRFGIAQGKTPIVVSDGPGFYTTRILAPLINEAVILVEEGVAVTEIDDALKDAGFPVGPITLLDEVGLDVAAHVSGTLGKAFAARGHSPSRSMKTLVEAGLLGRKSGAGFYVWQKRIWGSHKRPNGKVRQLIGSRRSRTVEPSEIVDRCLLVMVNEAAWCLHEGIIDSPLAGDVGAVLGLGFPPFEAGPFHYIERYGAKAITSRLDELARLHGDRFRPCPVGAPV